MSEDNGTDWESALITAIIDNRDVRTAIKQKINQEFFYSTQTRASFTWLLDYYRNPMYGDTPSWEAFMDVFPDFNVIRTEDSVVALCDKVRQHKLYADIAALIHEVSHVTGQDVSEGFDKLKSLTARLTSQHTVDSAVDVRDRLDQIRAEYFDMQAGKTGLKGRPYPWPALNEATLGCQDGQFVIIYGRPKSTKTWRLLQIADHFHRHGAQAIIFSQELTEIEITRRYVALACGIDYDKFCRGQLPPDVEEDFLDNLEAFVERPPVIVDMLTSIGEAALIEAEAKIEEYKCNVAFIDGMYFLGRDWKELTDVTRGTKRLAKKLGIPVVGTTQRKRGTNKGGHVMDDADDFGYSDSFFQDTDLALRISSEIENKKNNEVVIATSAIREGKSVAFTAHSFLATNLGQKKVISFGEATDTEAAIDESTLDGENDERE